ncbi:MAG: PQQ-dependent sugar dehydrogenase [Bacteroidota bacterium]
MRKVFKPLNIVLGFILLSSLMSIPAYAASNSAATIPAALKFTLVTSLTKPVLVTNAGDGSNRLFIVQQSGQIRIFANGSLLSTPFLNIAGLVQDFTGVNGEQGLLSLAFDPGYVSNGFFYIAYTTNTGDPTYPYTTTLARYHVSAGNPNLADPASGTVLLSIPKKYNNHNGSMLAFGPDGYLYISMGDGGSGGDPDNNAQSLNTMLGKILRIDVHTPPPAGKKYVIPATNPFYGSGDPNVKQEIWAYGLRNPWRISFDRLTGDLYIGDVGQNIEEEIDFQAASSTGGQNYGWHILEGNRCYNPSSNCVPPNGYVPPVTVYDHRTNDSYGCSISGGYVYRGTQSPSLQGVYFYGDYCSGKVFGLVRNSNNTWTSSLITSVPYNISSFGEDEQGELYLTDLDGGRVFKIASALVSISGNAGAAGATLSYVDGTPKTVSADASGNYSIMVPSGWSGTVTPSRTGFTFIPSSRPYPSVSANLTSQDFIASWVGSIRIQSNRDVVTMARPHIGSQVMAYDGAPAGSTNAYVPMLFKAAFGGSYNSALYIQNVDPANTANVTIRFYDSGGHETCSQIDTIPALASHGYWVPSITCVPAGWAGGVKIESDRDIVAVGRPHIGNEVLTYNGFAAGSLNAFIPMLFKAAFGGAYNAALYIQNIDPGATASVTIRFYDDSGSEVCSQTDTIAPLASKGYWTPSISCLPSGWVGGAKVESNTNIVTVGRPHVGSQVTAYDGFAAGGLSAYVPMLFKGAFGGSYNSALYLQNVDAASTANVTIRFYDSSGNETCSQSDTLPPLASKGYWVPSISCLGADWAGGVRVESDHNVVAVGRPHIGNEVLTYSGFTSGGPNAFMPMLFKQAFDGTYNSAFYIQNIDPSNMASVNITLYDAGGALVCTQNDTVASHASKGFWVPSLLLLCAP